MLNHRKAAVLLTGRTQGGPAWAVVLGGLVSISAGMMAVIWPGLTEVALLYIIAVWAIVTGILAIVAAIRLRRFIRGEWALALSGALSIVFGLLLAFWPVAGLLAVALLVASYAIAFGIILLTLAFELRSLRRRKSGPEVFDRRRPAAIGRM